MVVIDTNSNAVQEDLIIASHPTIDKCSGVQINLCLKLTKKKLSQTYTFHPFIHLTYHENCISNLHYLSTHLSILPSIHTSDLPQELSQTYTNQSIHPAYLKLTLIHPSFLYRKLTPSIHPSDLPQNLYLKLTLCIYPSIHLTYHKNYLKLTLIHPSNLNISLIHPSIHPSCISNLHYPFIHPSI